MPQTNATLPLRLIAHRGWSTRFPENSLIAFAAAIAAGADEIELDVWCSGDRVPFVCHDPTLERVSDLVGKHTAHTMAELRQAHIRMPDGSLLPSTGFPTLEEALHFCAAHVALNIHVKHAGPDDLILRFLHDFYAGSRPASGSYVAGARPVLAAALKLCPEIPRCCLEGQEDGAKLVKNAIELGCERVQFTRNAYSQRDVDAARAAGLVTNLFWSDDAEEIARLAARGISAPLTNDIGGVRPRLRDLGLVG